MSTSQPRRGMLDAAASERAVAAGDVETVVAAFPDTQGRPVAGQLATLAEPTLPHAPTTSSYERCAAGSLAPTAITWGLDNRTCALRVVGHGHGTRVENRVPCGDVDPCLAVTDRERARAFDRC